MYKFSNFRPFPSVRASLGALLAGTMMSLCCLGTAEAAEGAAKATAPAAAPQTETTTKKAEAPSAAPKTAPKATPSATSQSATAQPAPAGSAQPAQPAAPTDGTSAVPPEPTKEEREEARLAFEAGTKAFDAGDYQTAASEFHKAYAKVPSPHAEYWIAVSLDKADPENKDAATVVDAYAKFLSNPGASHVEAEKVEQAQARLVELKKLLPASIALSTTPPGAKVVVDGELDAGTTPLTLKLEGGAHKIEVSLEGYESAMIELNVEGGSAVEQQLELKALPPPPPPAVEEEPEPVVAPPEKRSIVPAAVTLGLGGAGLISGTIFGIMALNAKGKFNDDPTTENADTAERNALIADMSFGIALTLGITGIVLLTAEEKEEVAARLTKSRVLVAPYGGKTGGGITGRVTF